MNSRNSDPKHKQSDNDTKTETEAETETETVFHKNSCYKFSIQFFRRLFEQAIKFFVLMK